MVNNIGLLLINL